MTRRPIIVLALVALWLPTALAVPTARVALSMPLAHAAYSMPSLGNALTTPTTPPGLPALPVAWGYGYNGQLGTGVDSDSYTPVQVSNLSGVSAMAAGGLHSLALKADGTVWAWGDNTFGQLGNGDARRGQIDTPVQVSAITGVVAIAAGSYDSLALKSDGAVWAWGDNRYGQLGNGQSSSACSLYGSSGLCSDVPVQVSSLTNVVAIAAGANHNLALKSDGTIWAWGYNADGELGATTTQTCNGIACSTTPVRVTGFTGATAIAAGDEHSLALKSDGTVWAWGSNANDQLGNTTSTTSFTPLQVHGLSNVTTLAAGGYHSLALEVGGTVWAWGANGYGQLGNASTATSATPVQVSGIISATAIAAGQNHSLALLPNRTVESWGIGGDGELGAGGYQYYSSVPVTTMQDNVLAIGSGPSASHSLAVAGPIVQVSPSGLDFGDQVVGTSSAEQEIVISNTGRLPLLMSSVTVTGANASDFAITFDLCSGATVVQGSACTVGVTFTPAALGHRVAALSIGDDAPPDSPQSLPLSGDGTAPDGSTATPTIPPTATAPPPTNTSTPLPTPPPTATEAPPTAIPTPRWTPPPTATAAPPTSTPTGEPAPTATPSSTPLPTNTPTLVPPPPTNTPIPPLPTATPAPAPPTPTTAPPTSTPVLPTNTPVPAPTATAIPTRFPSPSPTLPILTTTPVTLTVTATATIVPTAPAPTTTLTAVNTPTPTNTPTPRPQTPSGPPPSTSLPGNTSVPTATPIVIRVIVLPVTPVAPPTLAAPAPTQPPAKATATAPSCSTGKPLSLAPRTIPKQVISGQSVSASVGAPAGAHVTARLQVLARKTVFSGTGKERKRVARTVVLYQTSLRVTRGAHGLFAIRGRIGYRASKPMQGRLVVTGRDGCSAATRNAGLTVLPPPPPLAVSLSRRQITGGGVLSVTVHTAPGAHVSVTLRVPGTRVSGHGSHAHRIAVMLYETGMTGTTGHHGLFTALLHVAYKPAGPMTALVSVTVRTNGAPATQTTTITMQPHL